MDRPRVPSVARSGGTCTCIVRGGRGKGPVARMTAHLDPRSPRDRDAIRPDRRHAHPR
jgi:hypothetical protein